MPYVQRDFSGKIIGLFSYPAPQPDGTCLTEPDPLADDHPEIIQFRVDHSIPESLTRVLTDAEMKEIGKEQERLSREQTQLQYLMLNHFQRWAELELALSGLLQEILNIQPVGNALARAMYFSLGGFEQRVNMLTAVIKQFINEHAHSDKNSSLLRECISLWAKICEEIKSAKRDRNTVAHGSILDLPHGGKRHLRVTSPAFDPIRVTGPLAKGTLVGLGIEELSHALKRLERVSICVDCMNKCIMNLHQFGSATLPETISVLEKNLQEAKNIG
jgi:hypothetical protein